MQSVLAAVGGPAPPIGPSTAPAVEIIPSDANALAYGATDVVPAMPSAPAHASAPAGGVSAWSPTETGGSFTAAAAGTWSPDRLVEAAVAVVALVLLMFFLLNRRAPAPASLPAC